MLHPPPLVLLLPAVHVPLQKGVRCGAHSVFCDVVLYDEKCVQLEVEQIRKCVQLEVDGIVVSPSDACNAIDGRGACIELRIPPPRSLCLPVHVHLVRFQQA